MKSNKCPKCNHEKQWKVRRGRCKCARCRYEWVPGSLPLRFSTGQWRSVLRYFMLGLSSNKIASETGFEKRRVLRALNIVREVMLRDIPEVFEGEVEVDETYVGGQWKNKRKVQRLQGTKRGRGTSKQPVFGILCRNGFVWAELVAGVEAATLLPLINTRVKRGSIVYSDTWRGYTGIAANGYVHRLIEHNRGEFSDMKGTHINGLEGFWGYLKRHLASKGGIRRERLPLYLAEYVWRFNHRKCSNNEQVTMLLKMLYNYKQIHNN
jgi:transposase